MPSHTSTAVPPQIEVVPGREVDDDRLAADRLRDHLRTIYPYLMPLPLRVNPLDTDYRLKPQNYTADRQKKCSETWLAGRDGDHGGSRGNLDRVSVLLRKPQRRGVFVPGEEGPVLEEYPTEPPTHVLNAWINGLWGLDDIANPGGKLAFLTKSFTSRALSTTGSTSRNCAAWETRSHGRLL